MITNKKINVICVAVIIFAVALTLLFINGESLGITAVANADREGTSDSEYFSANDVNSSWSTEIASHITMEGAEGSVSGSGAYFLNGNLYIVQSGYYVITGELEGGSIIVDASSKSRIWIMFDQVTVRAGDNAAFRIDQAKKVFLTLAEGTKNVLSDSKTMSDEALADGTNACIFTHDNLTVNGSGQLTINGNYKNGITAKDNLVIAGGKVIINAVGDGIRVNEKLKIRDTVLDIAAEDDGMVVEDNLTDNKNPGYIYVYSGHVSIVSKDDAINSTGDVMIDGGSISIAAADDGIHSDTNVSINGGTININECYEGIEALNVIMTGGEVNIYPSDDGINANGGSDGQVSAASTQDSMISIGGGKLTIVNTKGKDCDGLDSNGNIYISGGDIRISLPGSGTNLAIDYGSENGGVCAITGGTLVACGGSELIESFDETSTQCSILYLFEDKIKADLVLTLSDAAGNVLLEYEVPNNLTAAALSCPEMKTGETYTVSIGDLQEEITTDSVVTVYGDTSSMISGPGGAPGGNGAGPGGDMGNGAGPGEPSSGDAGNGAGPGEPPSGDAGNGAGPGGAPNGDPGNGAGFGGAPNGAQGTAGDETADTTDTTTSLAMVGASGAVMAAGLIFAFFYKKKEF